jgi:HEAT repeat protein
MMLSALILTGCSKGNSANVAKLRQDLKNPDADTRQNACIELGKLQEEAAPALDDLIPLLNDPDPVTKRLAAYAIGEMHEKAKKALPELRKHLTDPDRNMLNSVVSAIGSIDPKEGKALEMPNTMN